MKQFRTYGFRAFVCVLAALVLSGSALAQDDFEPDNSVSQALLLLNGVTDTHSLHNLADVDWSKFVVGPGGAVDINISISVVDVVVWLIRGRDGVVIAYDDLHSPGMWDFVGIQLESLEPGTYYTKVQRYGTAGIIPSYTLRASWVQRDAYEVDDTTATAKTISNRRSQNRSIHAVGDVDWAKFTVPNAGARNVEIASSFDTQLWLIRGSNGQVVGFDQADGPGDDSVIQVATLSAGTYFIKVREYGNDETIADYQLSAVWTEGAIAPDAFEPDNAASAAKVISNGQTQTRSIHRLGGVDWARFTIGSAGARNLRITTAPNTVVKLIRGSNGQQLAEDWSHGTGAPYVPQINQATLSPGTYFIRVNEHGNESTIASYPLRATWTSP